MSRSSLQAVRERKQRQQHRNFRAVSGVSIEEQRIIANEASASGSRFMTKINEMRHFNRLHRKTAKESTQKFDWIRDLKHLKKLEDDVSKDLDKLLIQFASDDQETRLDETNTDLTDKFSSDCDMVPLEEPVQSFDSSDLVPLDPGMDTENIAEERPEVEEDDETSFDFDLDQQPELPETSPQSNTANQPPAISIINLIKAQHQNLQQHYKLRDNFREQRESMRHILTGIVSTRKQYVQDSSSNETEGSDEWFKNVKVQLKRLVGDAIAGQGLLNEQLNDQAELAEKDYQSAYKAVLHSIQNTKDDSGKEEWNNKLAAVGGTDCPDKFLYMQFVEELQKLEQKKEAELSEVQSSFVNSVSSIDTSFSVLECGISKTGGWTLDNHQRYMKVYKECSTLGIRDERFFNRLKLAIPGIKSQELRNHDAWYRSLRSYNDAKKDVMKSHERKIEETLDRARKSFKATIELHKESICREAEIRERSAHQEKLRGKLEVLQSQKEARERIIEQQKQLELQQQEEEREMENAKRLLEINEKKKQIEAYRERLKVEKMADEARKLLNAQMEEEQSQLRAKENSIRVQYRIQEQKMKEARLKEEELQKLKIAAAADERIKAIAKSTPYANRISDLEFDTSRLQGSTVASKAFANAASEGLALSETGLFPTHGYDSDKLFKDARFKLGLALRDAGLHTTGIAQKALRSLKPNNTTSYRHVMQKETSLW